MTRKSDVEGCLEIALELGELAESMLREKLRREKSEVVERDYAIEQGFAFARRIRDAWGNWPARVAALMAADLGVDVHKLEGLLTDHVREQLQASAHEELNLHGT